jgi:plastocyanin
LKPFEAPRPPASVVGFTGPAVAAREIKLIDYDVTPARITVAVGTRVTFTNDGTETHNAASSDGGGWDTGLMARGQSISVTFNRPGTYNFNCYPHPSMIGQIVVTGEAVPSARTSWWNGMDYKPLLPRGRIGFIIPASNRGRTADGAVFTCRRGSIFIRIRMTNEYKRPCPNCCPSSSVRPRC